MDDQDLEHDDLNEAAALALAGRIKQALESKGIGSRHQAALVAQLCDISVSQARRKLQGAAWLFEEVRLVTQHCGVSLDDMGRADFQQGRTPTCVPATAMFEGHQWPCTIVIGHLLAPRDQGKVALQALRDSTGWMAGSASTLQRIKPDVPRYAVERLTMTAPAPQSGFRVAVVDDDPHAAESLCDWFENSGFQATPFHSSASLLDAGLGEFDAFVVDFILGSGQSSQPLVEQIRRARPQSPVALLTGHLRDGIASEDTLTSMMRALQVMFFEKPVRPAVIAAALQNSLDRLHGKANG
jgi:CheY-like chemotaxis protein